MKCRWLLIGFLLLMVGLVLGGCEGEAPEPIKIGLQAPLSGDYAFEGQGFRKAVQLLVDQTNASGGLLGRQVELIVEDDAGDPIQSALVARRLVDAGVIAVIGSYNSSATEPASEVYNDVGILHITPSSTATRLTRKGFRRFFRICFLDDRQGLFAATLMKETLGAQRIALLHDNSTYAYGLADYARNSAEGMGLDVVFFRAIDPEAEDFTPVLEELADSRPDAVYFTGYYSEGGLLLKQAAELGLELTWAMGDACNNSELVRIAGVENAVGTYVTTPPLPKDIDVPETQAFIRSYEERYGERVDSIYWLMAADAFNVIRYAIERTGSTDPAVLAHYLHYEAQDIPGLSGTIIGWDDRGDRIGLGFVAYRIDENGNFVLYAEQP